jgi:hypothetical protein
MFEIQQVGAKVNAVINRAEKHGKELVAAQTMRLCFITGAEHLDALEGNQSLRKSLFKKRGKASRSEEGTQVELPMGETGDLTEVRLARVPSITWKEKLPGYTLMMGSGLTATAPVEQAAVTLSDFTITPKDGGSVQIEVNLGYAVEEGNAGFFACQVQRLVNITLLPPGVELMALPEFEEVEAE